MVINQGDVYWIDFDEPSGSEPGYRHPHIVIQNNIFNRSRINTTVVCSLTSNLKRSKAPGNVTLKKGEANLPKKSVVNISQIFTVNKSDLAEKVGTLSKQRIAQILEGIRLLTEPREIDWRAIAHRDRQLPHVAALESLIKKRENICICGIILTEVLQGIREIIQFRKTQELFNAMIFLPMPYPVFLGAAEILRNLRRKGISIRNTVDCMIASVAIENDIMLLHNDRDFKPIEKHLGLKVLTSI